jgi:hypothetical protein
MKILIGCEFSATVRDAFARHGHDAWSCDLLPSERNGQHLQTDIFTVLDRGWDLMIFHWPCTRLANSGVRWLYGGKGLIPDPIRWAAMEEDARQFRQLLDAPIPRIAGENPVPHRYAREIMGDYSQVIQPWMFGHGETKATCLWLRNLPPLHPTQIVAGRHPRVHHESPGPERWKNRSRTLTGIANGMAEQWGRLAPTTSR